MDALIAPNLEAAKQLAKRLCMATQPGYYRSWTVDQASVTLYEQPMHRSSSAEQWVFGAKIAIARIEVRS